MKIFNIPVHLKTRDRLLKIGKFRESWDELLNRLLDEREDKKNG